MSKLGKDLLNYMLKWSGKSGGLILINELKKLGITSVDSMGLEQKAKLLDNLTRDYLSTFLGHSRFLIARAELVSILQIPIDSYLVNDREYKRTPQTPDMLGKPEA
jgi:hypothetical protein